MVRNVKGFCVVVASLQVGDGFSLESNWDSLCIYRWRRRRFPGAEGGSRLSQFGLNLYCELMRAAEHAPRDPFYFLERLNGFAEIIERGGVVVVERLRVIPPHLERGHMSFSKNASRHGHRFANQ